MATFELHRRLEPFRDSFKKSIIPYNKITPTFKNNINIFDSKFGGIPYLPKGVNYPQNKDGKNLYLLAQLNFEQMPKLPLFPDKGILQFYISDDMFYYELGMDFDNPTNQENFRVLYFDNIDNSNYEKVDFYDSPLEDFPLLQYPLALSFDQDEDLVNIHDYINWINFFPEYTLEKNKFDLWASTDLFFKQFETTEETNDVEDWYYNQLKKHINSKIGGYAYFEQGDMRYSSYNSFDIQLLQIASDNINISWGDGGLAHFFIQKQDLINRDFSNIIYYWDCG